MLLWYSAEVAETLSIPRKKSMVKKFRRVEPQRCPTGRGRAFNSLALSSGM
jgi:hypothetical protein